MNAKSWSVIPYLRTQNAAEAIAWYGRALGATEVERYEMPDGKIAHAELDIHGNPLCLADAATDGQFPRPKTYNDVPIILRVMVPDVDATFNRAIEEGAQVDRAPADQSYGERSAGFIDPFGHVWYLGAPIAQAQSASA